MARRKFTTEENGWATVVSLDPGGTTGWSVMCVEPDCLVDEDISVLASITHFVQGQVGGGSIPERVQIAALIELVEAWPDSAVIIEDFILRKQSMSRDLLSPVRITAVVEYAVNGGLSEVGNPREVFKQSPDMAKRTATDDRLKEWRLYRSEGGEQHARDATRHAITFLRRAKSKPRLRAEAWPHLYGDGAPYEMMEG